MNSILVPHLHSDIQLSSVGLQTDHGFLDIFSVAKYRVSTSDLGAIPRFLRRVGAQKTAYYHRLV